MEHRFSGLSVATIFLGKKASIRNAPLPPGTPGWDEMEKLKWEQVEDGARANDPGFKTVRKLLSGLINDYPACQFNVIVE